MRQKHLRDQEKVSKIDEKIEKARVRREEKLREDKKKSRRIGVGSVSRTERPNSDIIPRSRKKKLNRDMEDVVSEMTEAASTINPQRKKKSDYLSQNSSLVEENAPQRKS